MHNKILQLLGICRTIQIMTGLSTISDSRGGFYEDDNVWDIAPTSLINMFQTLRRRIPEDGNIHHKIIPNHTLVSEHP
jgi:hypothetical protein